METAQKLRELTQRIGPDLGLFWDDRFGWWCIRRTAKEGGPLAVGQTVAQAVDKACQRAGLSEETHEWHYVKR